MLKSHTKSSIPHRIELIKRGAIFETSFMLRMLELMGEKHKYHKENCQPITAFLTSPGMGTTTTFKAFCSSHPDRFCEIEKTKFVSSIHLKIPSSMEISDLSHLLATHLKAPAYVHSSNASVTQKTEYLLQDHKVKTLILDDFGSLAFCNRQQKNSFLNFLRSVSDNMNIHIVLAAQPLFWEWYGTFEQLVSRTEFIDIPPLNMSPELGDEFLKHFLDWVPLQKESSVIGDKVFRKEIARKAGGTLRGLSSTLKQLSVFAILSGHERLSFEVWNSYCDRK